MRNKVLLSAAAVVLLLAVSFMIYDNAEAAPTRAAPAFTGGGVSPTTGYNYTLFNFTVWYMDTDNDVPQYVAVFIDDVQYNMTCSINGTLNVTRFVPYYYNTYLSTGNHTYYFFANNTANETVRSPAQGSTQLIVKSAPPSGPSLTGGKHSPDRPTGGKRVDFSVTYSDTNGNAPDKVYLDYWHDDGFDNVSYGNISMNISGSDYTKGVFCYSSLTFYSGMCAYRFSTINNNSEKAQTTWSGFNITPVTGNDTKPVISNVTTNPDPPVEDENFTVTAVYSDADNDTATSVVISLYDKTYGFKWYNYMTITGSDYKSGVTCSYVMNLAAGQWFIKIDANNRNGSIRYPDQGSYHLINVSQNNSKPSNPLSKGGHTPSSPIHNQTVNFTVTYTDPGDLAPSSIQLVLGQTRVNTSYIYYNMSIGYGTNYTLGVKYFKTLVLPSGNYSYYFQATPGNTLTIIYFYPNPTNLLSVYVRPNGTVKDNPPSLYSASYTPQRPTSGKVVNFTIYCKDIDGDAPAYVHMTIAGPGSYNLYNLSRIGSNFKTGVVYFVTLNLTTGNYYYYYSVSSGKYWLAYPAKGNLSMYVNPPPVNDTKPSLYTPGVNPASPNSSTPVNFTIYYKDAESDAPSSAILNLAAGGSRNFTPYNMIKAGTGYSKGIQLYRVLTLSAGNHSYYFQVKSTNFTVTFPASSISTLYVAPVTGPGSDGDDDVVPGDDDDVPPPEIDGKAEITSTDDGGAGMDIIEIEEGFTISLVGVSKGKVEVQVTSDTPQDRIVVLGLEADLFEGADLEDIVIMVDGEEIALSDLQDLMDAEGFEPLYHIAYNDGSYDLYLYIPETTTHSVTAQVMEEESHPATGWIFVMIAIIVILLIVLILAIALLTAAQKKKKTEAFFEDFEIGMKEDDRVIRGDLEDKDWNDIIE